MYWNIEGLPTVLAFKGGKPVDEFVGNLPEAALNQFLDRLLPTEADRKANAGADLEQTDPVKAEQIYRDALAKNPNQESATLGLARLLIQQDRDAEAAALIEQLGPGSEQGAEVERLNALLWLRTTARDLEPEPALQKRLAASAKDAVALYQLGVRRAVEGKGAEALEMLYSAGEKDAKLAATRVREAMVKVFQIVGNRSPLADDYRSRLTSLLY
jgi:putative thioredoxin